MSRLIRLWAEQPALVVGFVGAILALAAAFGLAISEEQTAAIAGIITAIGAVIAAFITRSQVSPAKKEE